MSPAPRNHRRRGWPRGLYEPRPGYYTWRHPTTGETFALGRVPFATARNEAIAANVHVDEHKPSLVARLQGADHTVADMLGLLPVPKKPNTLKQYQSAERHILAHLGDRAVSSVTVRDCAELLDAQTPSMAVITRSRLKMAFRKALAKGWVDRNPAEATETPQPTVKRGRLTLETFRQVREHCVAAWEQRAMDVALVLGCDVSTLATLHRRMVDAEHLTFNRAKTGAWLRVPLHLRLDVAALALRDVVPGRAGHFFIVDGDNQPVSARRISAAFTAARRSAGLPEANAGGPTFHEIRSLAKRLYEEQGGVDTLALLGHADERTGEIYADPRGIEPVRVRVDPHSK